MRARILPSAGIALATVLLTTASAMASQPPQTQQPRTQPANGCSSNLPQSTGYVNSQKYTGALASQTDMGASDFTVAAGGCTISGVDTEGVYTGPSMATKVNILIKGGATHPAGPDLAPVSDKNITSIDTNPAGSFKVTLPSPVTLSAGHYWLIFQVKIPAGSTWSWKTDNVPSGAPDVWRNPAGGMACGTGWLPITATCSPVPDADLTYELI